MLVLAAKCIVPLESKHNNNFMHAVAKSTNQSCHCHHVVSSIILVEVTKQRLFCLLWNVVSPLGLYKLC